MDIGLVYIIIAQFFWATELILIRKFFPHINSFFLSAIGSVIGSLFYLPTFLVVREKIPLKGWGILFVYALTSWFLAQVFYVTGIQKGTSAFAVTLATLMMPLMTFIMAAIFLKEAITLKVMMGGIIMIAGFLIISL